MLTTCKVIFDSKSKKLKEITFSGKNMTCPTWGGKNFDTLFATSAKAENGSVEVGDEGGSMFRYHVRDGAKGGSRREFAG